MYTAKSYHILFTSILLAASLVLPTQAQQFVSGPSMGLDDAKSALRNPAVISFQRPKVTFGAKAHHLGLGTESGAPLRQGFVSASTPFLFGDRIGLGGSVQYFDSPIFDKGAFGLTVTGRILRFLSVGARVSALNLSYSRDEFVGVAPGDPVFEGGTSTTTVNSSLGIFAKPIPNLNLAVGVQNLNRPNLALGGGTFRAERQFFGGASYSFGPVRVRAEVANGRNGLESLVALEAYSTDGSYIRVGSDGEFSTAVAEGQLHVGGPLSINYQYGIPVASDLRSSTTGSHLVTVVYELGRSPDVPEPPSPPPMLLEASRPEIEPTFDPELYVTSSQDYVQHLEKRIEREIQVPREVLQSVSKKALGVLDSTFASQRGKTKSEPISPIPENIKVSDLLSSNYETSLTHIQKRLVEDSTRVLKLLGRNEERVKAIGMYNKIYGGGQVLTSQLQVAAPIDSTEIDSTEERTVGMEDQIPLREQLYILNPKQTTLYLLDPYLASTEGAWEVSIKNRSGEHVRSFTGMGAPPSQITWDWMTDSGMPIDQGVYRYSLEVTRKDGSVIQSNEKKFYVRKVVRKITIKVTDDPTNMEEKEDAMEIRFKE